MWHAILATTRLELETRKTGSLKVVENDLQVVPQVSDGMGDLTVVFQ